MSLRGQTKSTGRWQQEALSTRLLLFQSEIGQNELPVSVSTLQSMHWGDVQYRLLCLIKTNSQRRQKTT